jgi:hypothetical protein
LYARRLRTDFINLLNVPGSLQCPKGLKPIMATQTGKTLSDTAEVADTVFSLLPGRPAIREVVADSTLHAQLQQLPLDFAALKWQMAALMSQGEKVSSDRRPHSQRPSRPRSPTRPRSRSREPRPAGVCWYHWAFKKNAKKFTSPCAWTPGNHSGSR